MNRQYAGYGPLMPGFDCVPYNDLAALEKKLASNPDEYCAFMVEPIQVRRRIVIIFSGT
jgi:ornithine--oxo-acid transaminase